MDTLPAASIIILS